MAETAQFPANITTCNHRHFVHSVGRHFWGILLGCNAGNKGRLSDQPGRRSDNVHRFVVQHTALGAHGHIPFAEVQIGAADCGFGAAHSCVSWRGQRQACRSPPKALSLCTKSLAAIFGPLDRCAKVILSNASGETAVSTAPVGWPQSRLNGLGGAFPAVVWPGSTLPSR